MENKKYLKWYQKVAYGSGDMGSNFMYTFVSAFLLIYLTDTIGLNAGIVGTLMMISKIFDGFTDVVFGTLIDKTKNKMGKARPWMFWSTFPLAICEILLFMVPGISASLQYAYFFIIYTLLNAIFYTANNISYASLTALITKNPNERVQLGSFRFMFAIAAGVIISSITVGLVGAFGGGAAGWRMVAIIFSLLMILFNMISVLSVKEVSEEGGKGEAPAAKTNILSNFKYLVSNRYYLMILLYYIVMYTMSGITAGIGIYFCTYTLNNAAVLGLFTMTSMIPMIVGLAITPFLVAKWGIYKVNLIGSIISLVFGIPGIIAGYAGNIPLLLLFSSIRGLGMSPMIGTLNAVIADTATYTYHKDGVHLEGTMYSCSSMGIKVGGGIGSALCGWLLAMSGYDGNAAAQLPSAISMINFMYLVIPVIAVGIILFIVASLNVEKANKKLLEEKSGTKGQVAAS
ncbi:MAG TPA: MFS transporter [Clostridiales bacterium]|nr:MFS transporter [Clostridiales bacterium]